MGLISKGTGGGSDFEPVPTGTHIARCVTVVDLGLQETPWGIKEKVYIAHEVPGVRVKWTKDDVDHEGPALIGSTYTNSIHEKSVLGQHLVNWRGRAFTEDEKTGFDLFTILDVPCMISVTHTVKGEKTYANVSGIMGAPAGTVIPNRETDLLAYTPQDAQYAGNLTKLPEWLQKKCEAGHKMGESPQHYPDVPPPGAPPSATNTDFDDDIPF